MTRTRLLAGAAALIALAAFPAAASATHSTSGGPNKDFVAGTGEVDFGANLLTGQFHVNADSTATEGHFYARLRTVLGASIEFQGRTTCVRAHANRATVGGRVTQSDSPLVVPPGSGVLGYFEDNGEPNSDDPPDRFDGLVDVPVLPPGACPPPEPFALLNPATVEQGDFIVHDGDPSPLG